MVERSIHRCGRFYWHTLFAFELIEQDCCSSSVDRNMNHHQPKHQFKLITEKKRIQIHKFMKSN